MNARSILPGVLLAIAVLVHPSGAPSPSGAVRFAVIGDFGMAGPDEADVANLVISWAPDFVVTTGDNNYFFGAASTIDANVGQYYHAFIHPYHGAYGAGATTNRFFPTLGNHDYDTPDAQPYLNYFQLPGNERYYDVVRGPVHLFVLNSNWEEPDEVKQTSAQAAWFQGAVAASTARWKIVTLHHPPYSSGHHGPSDWMQWPFGAWGAHAVLAGHDHLYERITVGDVVHFVNGLGGADRYDFVAPVPGSQVRYNADFGAMLVEADDTQITFRFVTRTGIQVDTYTIYADPAAHPPAAPSGLTAVAVSSSEIDLAWVDNASNEDEMRLERSTDGVTFTPLATLGPGGTAFAVGGLTPGSTHAFRVSARNAAGTSPPSAVATATTASMNPPSAPAGLTARPISGTRIDLSWTDTASDESSVSVEQATNGGAFTGVATLGANATTYSATGLTSSATYGFRVRARNAGGWSGYSNTVTSRPGRPDLRVTTLTNVPAALRPGDSASVGSTTANQGLATAVSSVTRFYLVDGAGHGTVLGGTAVISPLAPGQQLVRTTTVAVPASLAPGDYQFQACADVGQVVDEENEGDNCRAWASPMRIGWPDLVTESATEPPAHVRRSGRFSIRDAVRNRGVAPAGTSKTQYFLTVNGQPGPKLSGERSIGKLAPGARSEGTVSVIVSTSTALGTYRLLTCADAARTVKEADETNNCVMSTGMVTIDP